MMEFLGMEKVKDGKYLKNYELTYLNKAGREKKYEIVSRSEITGPDALGKRVSGVSIVAYHEDRLLLLREFRMGVNRYIYNLCAGMIEEGESMEECITRELYEETGLRLTPIPGGCCSRPFFTTVGMTDESCGTVFGRCEGEPTSIHQEATEEIQVVLADKAECRRILREENVAVQCAYMLMHFIASEGDPFRFLDSRQE